MMCGLRENVNVVHLRIRARNVTRSRLEVGREECLRESFYAVSKISKTTRLLAC
jgi:hypothetical protein